MAQRLRIRPPHSHFKVVNLDYAGGDLMLAEDGRTYVIEINSIPAGEVCNKRPVKVLPSGLSITCCIE
jgi:glutathione synthase/RimK-type ligase-like ATP-grasp enzyme